MTMPRDINGRDSALVNLTRSHGDRPGGSTKRPTTTTSRRASALAWDVTGDGRTSVRGGYGMYFNTNSSQNLIVTVTNPPATPRVVFANPTFPNPPFDRTSGLSIRPDPVGRRDTAGARVERQPAARALAQHRRRRSAMPDRAGTHLLRSNDVNTAVPVDRRRRPAVFSGRRAAAEHRVDDDRAQELGRRFLVPRAHRRSAPPLGATA